VLGVLFDDSWPHEVVNNFVLWGMASPLYGKKVVDKANHFR
jgi:hypothetical protein